ncbi:MAG: hypothetical protein U9R25_18130 [Chloroflexota bacterium]|nr:hypothetical protein [Chloroflexota bacterium]
MGERKTSQAHAGEEILDDLIRVELQARASGAKPPDRIWESISSQVAAGPSPVRRRPPAFELNRVVAPLVQGLTAAIVLLLLGFSIGPNLWVQTYQFATGREITPTSVAPSVDVTAVPEIAESSRVLTTGSGADMLSTGVLLRIQEPQESPEARAPTQANYPELDPLLAKRHGAAVAPIEMVVEDRGLAQ